MSLMSLFDNLPTVEKCCCCINLKIGCIIIGLLNLLILADGLSGSTSSVLDKCKDAHLVAIFVYIYYAISTIMLVLGLLFVYGILMEKTDTTIWYMYGLVAVIIFQFVYAIVMLISGSYCSMGYIVGGPCIISLCVSFYFLVVVNSYRTSF